MVLDNFKLNNLTFQIVYPVSFEIWDRMGAVARRLSSHWKDLTINRAEPQRIVLVAPGVSIHTDPTTAYISLTGGLRTMDPQTSTKLAGAVEAWRTEFNIPTFTRVSMRTVYVKEYSTLAAVNAAIRASGIARLPDQKVFDIEPGAKKSGIDVGFRFEDDSTFAWLRVRAETVHYEQGFDPEFSDEPPLKKDIHRAVIEFDRGQLGTIHAEKFRTEDWLKGYTHVLRRDIEKVIGAWK